MNDSTKEVPPILSQIIAFDKAILCTKSLYFFLSDIEKTFSLFLFTVMLATKADERRAIAATALLEGESDPEKRDEYKRTIDSPNLVKQQLFRFASINIKNLITSVSDSFSCYVSHIVRATLSKNKVMLKSKEQVSFEDVIDLTKKDLIDYMIDKKINELSYGGITKVENFISERLGVKLFQDDEKRQLAIILNELRNIHVHNRGYVNDIFLARVPARRDFVFQKNAKFNASYDEILLLTTNCRDVAIQADETIARKFRIRRKSFLKWQEEAPQYF